MMETNPEQTKQNPEYDELTALYERIHDSGAFVKEFLWGEHSPQPYGAAVGSQRDLREYLGLDPEAEITAEQIADLPTIILFAYPGSGQSRLEAIEAARQGWQKAQERDPDAPDLYGSFEEKGYQVKAFLPANDEQPNQWTVTFEKDGVVVRTETIPLTYRPIFGPDVDDVAQLEALVDDALKEL